MSDFPAWIERLPALNASLNATSAVFLVIGYAFIRRRRIPAHRACMSAALVTSTIFLASYLTYHYFTGSTRFIGTGIIRPIYFTILISHVVLAAVVLPMALMTLWRALRERFEAHAKLARWTLPVWLYVSVTGVIVYVMLYHLYAA